MLKASAGSSGFTAQVRAQSTGLLKPAALLNLLMHLGRDSVQIATFRPP
jgi:hypothetical protein